MHIVVLAVGKLKEKYFLEAQKEYAKRIKSYTRLDITEINDQAFEDKYSERELDKVKEKEGKEILRKIKPESFIVALDINGEKIDSRGLARKIEGLALEGKSHVTFIIGGALGLSSEVSQRANWKLSFSDLTFPHQLMRIVLLEQVYRSFKIIKNEPYHR